MTGSQVAAILSNGVGPKRELRAKNLIVRKMVRAAGVLFI